MAIMMMVESWLEVSCLFWVANLLGRVGKTQNLKNSFNFHSVEIADEEVS